MKINELSPVVGSTHVGDVDQLLQVIQDLFMHVHDATRKKD